MTPDEYASLLEERYEMRKVEWLPFGFPEEHGLGVLVPPEHFTFTPAWPNEPEEKRQGETWDDLWRES